MFWINEAMSFVNDGYKILIISRCIRKTNAQIPEQLQIGAPLGGVPEEFLTVLPSETTKLVCGQRGKDCRLSYKTVSSFFG
jgi:hypothetical protein